MESNRFHLEYSDEFKKQLKKLDKHTSRRIENWIDKNLFGSINPRSKGKALVGNYRGCWRWRVGDYRVIGVIKDSQLIILCLAVGHRKEIY